MTEIIAVEPFKLLSGVKIEVNIKPVESKLPTERVPLVADKFCVVKFDGTSVKFSVTIAVWPFIRLEDDVFNETRLEELLCP